MKPNKSDIISTKSIFLAGNHQKLPFWYGTEDQDHIRSIFLEYERLLDICPPRNPSTRRPRVFVGRVSRYSLIYDHETQQLVSIDEVNVLRLALLRKGMHLPLKQTIFVRTTWGVEGLPQSIFVLEDQRIQTDLLGICSHLYAEPKWTTNLIETVDFSYRVSPMAEKVGYSGLRGFTDCFYNSFLNLQKEAEMKKKENEKKEFKWKIDDDDDEEDDEDFDVIEFDPNEPIIRRNDDGEVDSFSEMLIHEDEDDCEGSEEEIGDNEQIFVSSSSEEDDEDGEGFIDDEDEEEEEEDEDEEEDVLTFEDILVEDEKEIFDVIMENIPGSSRLWDTNKPNEYSCIRNDSFDIFVNNNKNNSY